MAKFDLTPSTFDKLKGNVILVKRDELEKFAGYCKENISKVEKLEDENGNLKNIMSEKDKEIIELKRKLNQKIISQEVGNDSNLTKLDKENIKLKKELELIKRKYKAMENMYLTKINEIKGTSCKGIKEEVSNIIKETIKSELHSELQNEFQKMEEPLKTSTFKIEI